MPVLSLVSKDLLMPLHRNGEESTLDFSPPVLYIWTPGAGSRGWEVGGAGSDLRGTCLHSFLTNFSSFRADFLEGLTLVYTCV